MGLGKIMPGISGAALAMMLNVYEKTINAIINIRDNLLSNIKYLTFLCIGFLMAVTVGSNIILYFLNKYISIVIFLFIGIILGGIIPIIKNIKNLTVNQMIISIIIIFVFLILTTFRLNTISLFNSSNFFIYLLSGIIDAFSSIIPGISGTALLMLIGTYNDIIKSFATIFNIEYILLNFTILFPFFIGILIGGYFTLKFVNYAFKHYKNISYICIIGFMFTSIFLLSRMINFNSVSFTQIIISLIVFILGYLISIKI